MGIRNGNKETLARLSCKTLEDLAYRVFFVSPRTITWDLNAL